MTTEYREFVEKLRNKLLTLLQMEEEKIFFKERAEGLTAAGDRLFIEFAVSQTGKEVCGIYTEELFWRYQRGNSVQKMAEEIQQELSEAKRGKYFEKTRDLNDYEKVKKDLFIRLLNRERHEIDLNKAVYRILGDVALVLYMKVGEADQTVISMKIRREYIDMWGLDVDDVFEEALRNTYKISPPRIYYWEKLVYDQSYEGEEFMDENKNFFLQKDEIGNCLSTTKRTNGAVAVFLPGVAKRIAKLMGQDFYLVFTSVHEVMIHNVSMVEPEDLRVVLRQTIEEATPVEDYLTSRIYRYCRSTQSFICV